MKNETVFGNTAQRYIDFEQYQCLCDHLQIHESRRCALFGVDNFYNHIDELINTLI